MTPKEKAEQLVRKYYTFGLNNPAQSFSWYECQQCALIAIDEIIKALNDDIYIQGETDIDSHREYLIEVKSEIENL